jgi:xylulose-5-phosphate/fructose-6-phosphate phosphoketolase
MVAVDNLTIGREIAAALSLGRRILPAQAPLRPGHIKPRLLGHWGTDPGLNLIYVRLNRLIRETDTSVMVITGPGHGVPAVLGNLYLEGTYSELYPEVSQDIAGLRRQLRQFATPGAGVRATHRRSHPPLRLRGR